MRKHRGEIKTSKRQQAILKATRRGRYYSAMDLVRLAGIPNPAEAISALRLNGVPIEKRDVLAKDGRKRCEWRIG